MAENHAHGEGLPAGNGVAFTGGAILGFIATAVVAFVVMIGSSPPVVHPMMQPNAAAPATAPTPDANAPGASDGAVAASASEGADLAITYACTACHSSDGVDGAGPTWLGVAGSERTMEGGEVVAADRDYLVQSIVDPSAHIVEGFFDAMPKDFGDRLSTDEIDTLVSYIESLGS